MIRGLMLQLIALTCRKFEAFLRESSSWIRIRKMTSMLFFPGNRAKPPPADELP